MRRVAGRETVEFEFLQVRQNVDNCEWLDGDSWLRNQAGKTMLLLSAN
jgi:hypothetical protein